jgi:histidyl-tRNA synthetase
VAKKTRINDRLGLEAVEFLLGPGRKDDSGDFTKGAGLDDIQITRIINFTGWGEKGSGSKSLASANEVTLANFEAEVKGNKLGEEGVAELTAIRDIVAAAHYDDGRIVIDPSVVRGLEYYTGPVYEVELTFEIDDEKGRPVRFGSVGGGGRYDGLVSRFMGQPVPATGFSIGVSRLQAALTALGKLSEKPEAGPVVVTVFDRDRVADYQRMVAALRAANIRAELYLGNPKNNLATQLKYADKRGSPCAVIQGSDEKARHQVLIKDLGKGAAIAELAKDREEYLRRQDQAQHTVPEDRLVDAVRLLLEHYGY